MPRRIALGAMIALVSLLAACEVPVVETSALSGPYAAIPAGALIAGVASTFPRDAGSTVSPTGTALTLSSLTVPVADVDVALLDAGLKPIPNAPKIRTDAGGRFEVAGLPLGRTFVLEVKGPDGRALRTLIATVAGGEQVTISPATTIAAAMLLTDLKDVPPAHDPRAFARLAHEVALYTTPAEFELFREDRQLAAKVGAIAAGSKEVWDLLVGLKKDVGAAALPAAEVGAQIVASPRPTATATGTAAPGGAPSATPGPIAASVILGNPNPAPVTPFPTAAPATPAPSPSRTATPRPSPTPTPTPTPTATPTPSGTFVKTLAGSRTAGATNGSTPTFNGPRALVLRDGKLWIADAANHRVRSLRLGEDDSATSAATLAGGAQGFSDGSASSARFNSLQGLAWRPSGDLLFVADALNDRIRMVAPNGAVTTLEGPDGEDLRVQEPIDIVFADADTAYVTERTLNRVTKLALSPNLRATATVLAGPADGAAGFADLAGEAARFRSPRGLALDAQGNLLVADMDNNRIRRIHPETGAVTTVAGSGTQGSQSGANALEAQFNMPCDVAVASDGAIYVADTGNDRIRKIAGAAVPLVTTLAGSGTSTAEVIDGAALQATFRRPRGLAVDGADRVYVADTENHAIRVVIIKAP